MQMTAEQVRLRDSHNEKKERNRRYLSLGHPLKTKTIRSVFESRCQGGREPRIGPDVTARETDDVPVHQRYRHSVETPPIVPFLDIYVAQYSYKFSHHNEFISASVARPHIRP